MCGPDLADKIAAVSALSAEHPNDTAARLLGAGLQELEIAAVAANMPAQGERPD